MLFTAYKLVSDSASASNGGLANFKTICTPSSTSIVQDKFDFITITIAAHEIGHSIGAYHDGEMGNFCNGDRGFIMASVSGASAATNDLRNPWYFSSCSVDYFRNTLFALTDVRKNCLLTFSDQYNSTALDKYLAKEAGQVYDVDQQCEYALGQGSYFCRSKYTEAMYEDICPGMFCSSPSNPDSCTKITPAKGTSCGSGKWCVAGFCVEDPTAPTYACVLGDQTGIIKSNMTCAELADQKPWECYANVTEQCCTSCKKIDSGNAECQYGDKETFCTTTVRPDCYTEENVCCGTCSNWKDGNKTGCEYGDRNASCDANLCATYDDQTRNVTCCRTCEDYVLVTTSTPPATKLPHYTTQQPTTTTPESTTEHMTTPGAITTQLISEPKTQQAIATEKTATEVPTPQQATTTQKYTSKLPTTIDSATQPTQPIPTTLKSAITFVITTTQPPMTTSYAKTQQSTTTTTEPTTKQLTTTQTITTPSVISTTQKPPSTAEITTKAPTHPLMTTTQPPSTTTESTTAAETITQPPSTILETTQQPTTSTPIPVTKAAAAKSLSFFEDWGGIIIGTSAAVFIILVLPLFACCCYRICRKSHGQKDMYSSTNTLMEISKADSRAVRWHNESDWLNKADFRQSTQTFVKSPADQDIALYETRPFDKEESYVMY